MPEFIYLVMSLPKDSNYLFSKMHDEAVPTHIYAIYNNMQSAVHCLNDLYQMQRVHNGETEYHIIKKKVASVFRG